MPASANTLATKLVVVVLPCVPAIATPVFKRINSASIIARGTATGEGGCLRAFAGWTDIVASNISDCASGLDGGAVLLLQGNDYYYQGAAGELGQKIKVGVFVEFDNKESARLGMPLPKGVVRVYKKDSAGNAQFIGEDRIDHTPKNEKVRLKLGDAFDVTADKKQTDFKKLSGTGKYNYVFESAYQLVLKNAKKEAVTVTVQEPVPGDWQILSASHIHTKGASNTAVWKITVPAEGSTVLTYRALVRY